MVPKGMCLWFHGWKLYGANTNKEMIPIYGGFWFLHDWMLMIPTGMGLLF